jgi:recombinational DNA repair protein RecT
MQSETLKLCDPVSVLDTVLTAANLGLDFIDQLIFIGPFERKVTDGQGHEQHAGWTAMPIVGYRGMITVAHRAGFFMDIQEVRAGDNIQVFLGTDNTINHSVGFGARGETVGAYCIIRDRDHKTLNIEVMNGQDLEACRRKTDAWVYSFGEMSRVAVTRKAFKRLPNHNRCVRLTGEVNERNFTGQSVHDLVDAAATPAPGQAA